MKLYTALAATLSLTLLAAAPAAAQFDLGLKGGLTFSKASVEDDTDVDLSYLSAFGGGAFFRFPLGPVALQPEILYARKGATLTGGDFDDLTVDLKLDYVEFPVLLVLPIGDREGTSPYLFGGGAFAFELDCAFAAEDIGLSTEVGCDPGSNTIDLEFERKKNDSALVFGAGVTIPAGRVSALIEGRYTLGLSDLDDSGGSDSAVKNRAIAVYAGVSFGVGG